MKALAIFGEEQALVHAGDLGATVV